MILNSRVSYILIRVMNKIVSWHVEFVDARHIPIGKEQ